MILVESPCPLPRPPLLRRCMAGPPPPPFGSNFDGYFQLSLPIMGPSRCLEVSSATWSAGRNYVRLNTACTSASPANSWAATRWFNNGTTYTQARRAGGSLALFVNVAGGPGGWPARSSAQALQTQLLQDTTCWRHTHSIPSDWPCCLQFRNGLNGNCLAVDNSTQFVAQAGELCCTVQFQCKFVVCGRTTRQLLRCRTGGSCCISKWLELKPEPALRLPQLECINRGVLALHVLPHPNRPLYHGGRTGAHRRPTGLPGALTLRLGASVSSLPDEGGLPSAPSRRPPT